jgi:large subunit ribosomal protein L4
MEQILANLGVDSSALVLLPEGSLPVELSARNLPDVKTLRAQYLNIRDLFNYDYVVMPLSAVQAIEAFLG